MPNRKRALAPIGEAFAAGSPAEFFSQHPYFHVREFLKSHERVAAARALHYHSTEGRLFNVRKGTYIWKSLKKEPDPFLLGTRLAWGSVSHSSALWFHRLLPPQKELTVLTRDKWLGDFKFAGVTYRSVKPPKNIPDLGWGITRQHIWGLPVDVCSVSRALVDCLDRLDLSPPIEELWDMFASRDDLDMQGMVGHALEIGNRVTCARLGIFLEKHPNVHRQRPDLSKLRANRPKTTALMDPSHHDASRSLSWPPWRLMMPSRLFRRLFPNN